MRPEARIRLWLGRAEQGACERAQEKEGGSEIASQSTGAHKMSDVAVDGAGLYSGPPNHPNDRHGWQLEISLQALCRLTLTQYTQHRACGQQTGLFALPTGLIPLPMLCGPRIAMAPSPPTSPSICPVGLGLRKTINSRRPEIAAVQQMSSAQSRPCFPDGSPRRRTLGNTARIDTSDPCPSGLFAGCRRKTES